NRMKDTYFLKCLEQHERLKPLGSWERTFMELLHQSFEKHSKKYVHRWKLRGTKYNRLLFQLLPLEHGMKGKGRGLLPTPTASDERGGRMASTQRVEKGKIVEKSNLRDVINQIGKVKTGQALHPDLSEWLMGFPKDWTRP